MEQPTNREERWSASFYSAEATVDCPVEQAWKWLLDYRAWNPTFQGADVERVAGLPNTVGESVLIGKTAEYMDGELVPQFYADTLALSHQKHHVMWYVYPTQGRLFRNFVDFRLVPDGERVRFEISYYEQNQLEAAALESHRAAYGADLRELATAFKSFCERAGGRAP